MERLTKRNEDGTAFYPYCFLNDTCGGMGASEKCNTCGHSIGVCERLADYEDAGLTPEEIVELKEFYGNPLNTAVPAVHVMTQWIPVKEQLPENDNIVLVTCKGKKGLLGINRAYCDDSGSWHGSGSMSGVIAWMPLPEPYKDGDNQ